jgi:hypothetical protein
MRFSRERISFFDDVGSLAKLFPDRFVAAAHPNFQLAVGIEKASRLNAELTDALVENTVVAHL